VLASRVYVVEARGPADPDIILTVTYKNWASLDGLADREEAVGATVYGGRDKANQASISREAMRDVLGSETIHEMILK